MTGDDPEHPADSFPLPGTDGRILDTAPEFVLYEAGGHQYVVDTARDLIVREQPAQAAVLDQQRLYKPALNKSGTVKVINLRSGKLTGTTDLGSACVPNELQHSGTLLSWSCASQDAAGVRDLATGHTYPAPASSCWATASWPTATCPAIEASRPCRRTAVRPTWAPSQA
ncbi:hypothetical protein [Streptomyces sp. NPDC048411]|uniref:hypothetical protein n=1 Tax=Streptomyces sp. NPDC048411 TaxID=3157206 RepID=UPI003451FFB6